MNQRQINELLATYAAARDQVIFCQNRAEELRRRILDLVPVGRYKQASVYQCKAQKITVRSYVRSGFKAIRIKES